MYLLKFQAMLLLAVGASQCENKNLIKDCPEEKIVNKCLQLEIQISPMNIIYTKGNEKK